MICIKGNQILGGTTCSMRLSRLAAPFSIYTQRVCVVENELGIIPTMYPQVNIVLILLKSSPFILSSSLIPETYAFDTLDLSK